MTVKIILHTEAQLVDWGESRAGGPWIKLRLADPEQLEVFRGMDTATAKHTGHILNITIAEGDIAELAQEKPKKGPYGQQAKALVQSGFFRAPAVWKAIGTDGDFRAWVRTRPCVVCGQMDWREETGERTTEAAHVRRAGESGVAHKADYACVPMCAAHHRQQHQHGEYSVLADRVDSVDAAEMWFDGARIETVQEWARVSLKETLGHTSWTDVAPTLLASWAADHNLTHYLPKEYR